MNTPSDVPDHDLHMRRASYESKNCNWNVFGSSSKPGSTNSGLIGQSIFKVYDTACITEGMKYKLGHILINTEDSIGNNSFYNLNKISDRQTGKVKSNFLD